MGSPGHAVAVLSREAVQNKNVLRRWRSDLPTFYFSSALATVCRGWQGYRASIISVSPHDFLPQPIEATACLSCRDWLCHRGVADGADRGDGIAGVPRAGVCTAGADRVAGGWLSRCAGAGVGV